MPSNSKWHKVSSEAWTVCALADPHHIGQTTQLSAAAVACGNGSTSSAHWVCGCRMIHCHRRGNLPCLEYACRC